MSENLKDSAYVMTENLNCLLDLNPCHNDLDCGTCCSAIEYRKNKNKPLFLEQKFPLVELSLTEYSDTDDKDKEIGTITVLFCESRIRKEYDEIPEGTIIIQVRHAGEDPMVSLESSVIVDHGGDVIITEKIYDYLVGASKPTVLSKCISVGISDYNFIDKSMTFEEYMNSEITKSEWRTTK